MHTMTSSPPWVRTRLSAPTSAPRPVESMKSTPCEVDDDPRLAIRDERHHVLAEAGSGGNVDLAGDRENGGAVLFRHLDTEIQRRPLPLRSTGSTFARQGSSYLARRLTARSTWITPL